MRLLGVHPGPLMYTKIFLRLEPLGLELVAAAVRAAGHEVRLIDLQVESHRDLSRGRRRLAAGRHRVFVQLPRQHSGDRRSRESGEGAAAGTIDLRRRPQRVVRRAGDPRAWRRRDRLRAARRGRGRRRRRCWRRSKPGADLAECRVRDRATAKARRPALSIRSTTLLPARDLLRHRRKYFLGVARPLRVDRVLARLPVGLLVLQRLDLLRPQLPRDQPRAGRRGPARDPRARRLHRRRRRVHPRQPRHRNWARRWRAPASRSAITSKPAATCCCATRRCSASGSSSASPTCSSGSRRSTRRGCKKYRKRVPLGRNFEALEFARSLGIELAINLIVDPDWDRRALPRLARVVPRTARDHQYQRQHALSRHRELADRGAPAHDARLPPVRHPARGTADPAAACRSSIEELVDDAARDLREAPRTGATCTGRRPASPGFCCAARPTSSRACSSSTASTAPTCCSPIMPGRSLRDPAAAADGETSTPDPSTCMRRAAAGPRDRRRDRALRRLGRRRRSSTPEEVRERDGESRSMFCAGCRRQIPGV